MIPCLQRTIYAGIWGWEVKCTYMIKLYGIYVLFYKSGMLCCLKYWAIRWQQAFRDSLAMSNNLQGYGPRAVSVLPTADEDDSM